MRSRHNRLVRQRVRRKRARWWLAILIPVFLVGGAVGMALGGGFILPNSISASVGSESVRPPQLPSSDEQAQAIALAGADAQAEPAAVAEVDTDPVVTSFFGIEVRDSDLK